MSIQSCCTSNYMTSSRTFEIFCLPGPTISVKIETSSLKLGNDLGNDFYRNITHRTSKNIYLLVILLTFIIHSFHDERFLKKLQ